MRVVVLAGGFGGARMAHGFAQLPGIDLAVIVNTADDLVLHGLNISPDLDTVMYTLSGWANAETGWGVRNETWSAAEMLTVYGQPTWFGLGDRDIATHIVRTAWLRDGLTLTEATDRLKNALDVRPTLLPMTDSPVQTKLRTADGWLDFQDYFVRRHFADAVRELRFDGVERARPTDGVMEVIATAELVVIAPSNPFVSVGPILAVPGMLDALLAASARVVAISPIVGGSAFRGPAADMLRSLASDDGSAGVARYYAARYPGLIDDFVLDESDAGELDAVNDAGLGARVENTIIASADDRRRLAERLVA